MTMIDARPAWIRPLAVLLAAAALSACSGVLTSDQAAKRYYALMPLSGSPAAADAEAPALALRLTAVPGLDSDRIQALGTDASLQRYANARWPDHLPEVLGSVLRRSLEESGRFSAVTTGARAPAGAWSLELEIQQFYGVQTASRVTRSVVVELAGELACGGLSHRIRLEHDSPVAEERLVAVVSAHQEGLDAVTRDLLSTIGSACL
jgi:ABC-type uncharacterized transport system auxiliary subunit